MKALAGRIVKKTTGGLFRSKYRMKYLKVENF